MKWRCRSNGRGETRRDDVATGMCSVPVALVEQMGSGKDSVGVGGGSRAKDEGGNMW